MGRKKDWRGTWDRIEALFDRVGGMGEAEREAYLAECDASPEVIAKVRELLASDQVATEEGFLSPVMSPRAPEGDASPEEPEADSRRSPWARAEGPSRFGPYRVIEEIGRGGMGVVYLAERDDGAFEQRVAIKMVSGAAREGAHARFSRERQILADLSHPNIARLLGGGTAENGEPYLVMEWIDGLSIDRYCEQGELSTRRRLELLAVVCDAVQAAHQRLIVHRDIKPSNVLVDQDGQVKLLDFGIATLLDASGQGLTATGGRLMTPQYASPEQLRGEAAGVATDIYQLGLLAYELLTGSRPYELAEVAPAEAMRLVLDDIPTPPSAFTGHGQATPRGPMRELNREIDALVGKALDKEPARRYASADRLREDIERYLAGLPISARPATFGYQLGKLVRRHVYFFGFAAAALAVMVTMAVLFTQRVIEERNLKEAEAERAERLRQESEEVVDFLVGLFEVSDPDTSLGETITARELLDRGAADVEEGLDEQPLVKARLLGTIGKIYGRLGLYDSAEPLFERAVGLRREHPGEPLDLAASLRGQAGLWMRKGRLDEAEQALLQAQALIDSAAAGDDPVRAQVLHELGYLRQLQGHLGEAEAVFLRALEVLESTARGVDDSQLADLLNSLGALVSSLGRPEEALAYYERAFELREKLYGPDHPELAKSLNNMAALQAERGHYDLALPIFERSHAVLAAAYGDEHPSTSQMVVNVAIVKLELGRLDEAEAELDALVRRLESRAGSQQDAILGQALNVGGSIALEKKEWSEAESYYRRSLDILGERGGTDHPSYAQGQNNLAEALKGQGRLDEAESYFRRSLALFERRLGEENLLLAWPLFGLAQILEERGELAGAEKLYRRAVELRVKFQVPESEERRRAEQALRDVEERLGTDRPEGS